MQKIAFLVHTDLQPAHGPVFYTHFRAEGAKQDPLVPKARLQLGSTGIFSITRRLHPTPSNLLRWVGPISWDAAPKAKLPPVKQGMGGDQLSSKAPPEATPAWEQLCFGNHGGSRTVAEISIPSSSPGTAQPVLLQAETSPPF